MELWGVIIFPSSYFSGDLTELSLNLIYEWVIIHALNFDEMCLLNAPLARI